MMIIAAIAGRGGLALAASFPDVSDAKYAGAIDILSELKVMIGDDAGLFRPGDTIRRSEFAAVAVRLAGIEDQLGDNTKPNFPDVSASHWAVAHINLAVANGYLVGDLEGTFRPDANLSVAEAATILVRVVGHNADALNNGGYPNGYVNTALDLGILENELTAAPRTAISRADVALCAWNSLSVK
jgi:hypothetical protein